MYGRLKLERINVHCLNCGHEFTRIITHPEVKHCSKRCANQTKNQKRTKPRPDLEVLKGLYIERALSPNEIARAYGVSQGLVRKWLKHYGIPLRSILEASKISGPKIGQRAKSHPTINQLEGRKRAKEWQEQHRAQLSKSISENTIGKIHPKARGRKASEAAKQAASDANSGRGAPIFKSAYFQRTGYQRYGSGKREDLGIFVRSRWEANYARYLNWLKAQGEILDWKYEAETFVFQSIKRGTRSYTPDFKVWERNGEIVYHEVKGWMTPKSRTQLKRMAKYYPKVKLLLIDAGQYRALTAQWREMIPNWE